MRNFNLADMYKYKPCRTCQHLAEPGEIVFPLLDAWSSQMYGCKKASPPRPIKMRTDKLPTWCPGRVERGKDNG